jgi:hypothetical protein
MIVEDYHLIISFMAKILDRDDKAVLIKFTVSEYERLTTS